MNQGISIGAGATRNENRRQRFVGSVLWMMVGCLFTTIAPELAFAGASPFTTGATAASTNLLSHPHADRGRRRDGLGCRGVVQQNLVGMGGGGHRGYLPRVRRAADRHLDPRHVRRLTT